MPPPHEWVISQVCETFGCLPSQAIRELERDADLVFALMDMRAYVATKRAIDNATSPENAPDGPMVDLVFEFEKEAMERRRQMSEGTE